MRARLRSYETREAQAKAPAPPSRVNSLRSKARQAFRLTEQELLGPTHFVRRWRPSFLTALALAAVGLPAATAFAGPDPAAPKLIFRKRCMGCHTFGKGTKVGPDLKGVTDRRKREWLLKFIHSSSSVIEAGDPVAVRLFNEFKRERMPDWTDLSPEEIGAIVDYLASNGPEQKEPDERHASTASVSEIDVGRRLFRGEKALTYGGVACQTCHHLRTAAFGESGNLGPDLSDTYFRYQDKALTEFLRRPCVLRELESSTGRFLTPQESFELKSYLAKTAAIAIPPQTPISLLPPKTLAGDVQPAPRQGAVSLRTWFAFTVWPYAAFAVFVAGAVASAFLRHRNNRYSF